MSFSGDESVSSGFSLMDSSEEPISDNEYAYSEGTADDAESPQDLHCEELPSKRKKTVDADNTNVPRLLDMAAECIASCHPFEMVERFHHHVKPVPQHLQLDIMKRAFPRDEKLIQMSSFTSRGYTSFSRWCFDMLREADDESLEVRHAVQIGFMATATIVHKPRYKRDKVRKTSVSLQFDRQRITSAVCSVHRRRHLWCRHIVRLVFYRMRCPMKFKYRLPISYCLEELDIEQHKLIIQNVLSMQPLEFLSASRKLLDNLVDDDAETVRSDAIPDATAGAGLSEIGMWHVDERNLRRMVRDHCTVQGFTEEIRKCYQVVAEIKALSNESETCLLSKNRQTVEDDDIEQHCWEQLPEIDVQFQIIQRLLRKGDVLAVTVLRALTEEWLCVMEDIVKERRTTGIVIDASTLNCSGNIPLFTCTLGSCLLCRLIAYWRLAVMNPWYSKELVSQMETLHKSWAKRLDQAIKPSQRIGDRTTVSENSSRCFSYVEQADLTPSFKGWNRFRHIQAWASDVARNVIVNLTKPMKSSSRGYYMIFNADSTVTGSELATSSCLVRCLKFYGFLEESLRLAVHALQRVFPINLGETTVTCRSKKVKKRELSDLTIKLWGERKISLCWAVTALLEVVCSLDDAWTSFTDVDDVTIAGSSSGLFGVQHPVSVALPVCFGLYFSTVPDDCFDSLYISLTQIIHSNKLVNSLLRRSDSCTNRAGFFVEAGRNLNTGMTSENFNFGRFSRLLLGATAGDNCSVVRHAVYKLLQHCITEQASALAGHVEGHGCDNQFSYALTEYTALLVQLLKRYGNDRTTANKIMKEAISPIENLITGLSSTRPRPNDTILLIEEAVLYNRLCRYITELRDVADMFCDFQTPGTRRLSNQFEWLHLLEITCKDKENTLQKAEHTSRTCGALLHLTLLSLTKIAVCPCVLRELHKKQLRDLPKRMRAVGSGTFIELLWFFGWGACLSNSELLYHLILSRDFVVPTYETFSDATAGALCSLMIEAASAVWFPTVCEDFFTVIKNLGTRVEQQIVRTVSSLSQRRIPKWPYYVLFRMARSLFATLWDSLNLTVAAYRRLWAYCDEGFDLSVLLKDQRLDHSLVADLHNLGCVTVAVDGMQAPASSTIESTLRLLMDYWIDPFVSFNIVAEIARVYSLPEQLVGYNFQDTQSPSCWQEPVDCLKTLMDKVPQSCSVIERCKREFNFLITGQSISVDSVGSSKQKPFLFRQQAMASDLVCLDIILQTCSDSNITMSEICLQLYGTEIVDEYNRRKERPACTETRIWFHQHSIQFYYSRILEGNPMQPWQLPVTDVLRFSSDSL